MTSGLPAPSRATISTSKTRLTSRSRGMTGRRKGKRGELWVRSSIVSSASREGPPRTTARTEAISAESASSAVTITITWVRGAGSHAASTRAKAHGAVRRILTAPPAP